MRGPSHRSTVAVMTETLDDPLPEPPPPPPPPPSPPPPLPPPAARRLERDPDDRVVGGVCAAFGRYTDTDPVLWRVTVAVLTVFGGAGLALYALGWLLIPRTGAPQSVVERSLRGPHRPVGAVALTALGLLAVLVVLVLGLSVDGSAVLVVLVVGAVVLLVLRERRDGGARGGPQPWTQPPWTQPPGTQPLPGAQPQPWAQPPAPSSYGVPPVVPTWEPAPPRPPRERSALGPVTLSSATLLAGLLLLLRELGVDGITGPRVLAAAVLVVGAGLVVGTWVGRARWLALVGAGLLLLLVPTVALDGQLAKGVGERTWVPGAAQQGTVYELGVGEASLDLRSAPPGSLTSLSASVGIGRLVVLVPEDLRVRLRPEVGVGALLSTGLSGRSTQEADPFEDRTFADVVLGPTTGPELVLDAEVGLGELEVRRVAP